MIKGEDSYSIWKTLPEMTYEYSSGDNNILKDATYKKLELLGEYTLYTGFVNSDG